MQVERLRLAGFKSFVDPTELVIEPGLTGIVGPNGCGKSNLVEALRWVMGESSAKRLRGGEMDDVIFGGSERRPARNLAEVALTLDNGAARRTSGVQRDARRSRSRVESCAAPARHSASMAERRAPATCKCCSPMRRPGRIPVRWSDRAGSAR